MFSNSLSKTRYVLATLVKCRSARVCPERLKTATNAQEKVIEGKRENLRWLVVKNSTTIFQNYQTIIILQIKKLSEIVKYFSKSGALRH